MKVAIYARYSSENQRDASIADQLRVCREFATRQGWTVIEEFTDHAVSGATLLRAGFQALMRDLAGMLSAARDSKRSPDTGELMVQIKLVAGARNRHYLQLWRLAS